MQAAASVARPPLRVLMVEDTEPDAELIIYRLQQAFDVRWHRVQTGPDLQAALERQAWDLVIADYELPQFDAVRALAMVRAVVPDQPFIIVSGRIDQPTAVAAMRAGAHDYFHKDDLERLLPAVERELKEAEERRARRAAEASLRERDEQYRRLVEYSPDPIYIQSEGQVVFANPAALQFFGAARPEALLGRSIWEVVHASSHAVVRERLQVLQQGGQLPGQEERFVRLDGSEVAVEVMAAPTDWQGRPAVQVNFRDITPRKQAEAEILRLNQDLRRRVEELQTLLDILPVGICVAHDPAGEQMTINPAGARMLGIPPSTNPSKSAPAGDALPFRVQQNGVDVPADELPMQFAAAHDVSVRDADFDVVHADGRTVNLLEYAAPLHDEQGRVRGCVGIFVDITERKQVERRQQLLAEASRVLSASLDYQATLQTVARLPLPELADSCLVYLAEPGGPARVVAAAQADPVKEALLLEASRQYSPDPANPASRVGQVLRTGQSLLIPEITPALLASFPLEPGVRRLAERLAARTLAAAALRARGATLGVVILACGEPGRRYGPADVRLVEELAARAAVAIDNARLFQQTQALNAELEQRVVERTQQLQAANTDLQEQIAERQQAEERFRALLEAAPDAFVIMDQAGLIVLVNSQAEAAFGFPRAELIGQPVEMLLPMAMAELRRRHRGSYVTHPRTREMGAGLELFGQRRDGSRFPVEISLSPLHTEEGTYFISAIRDISSRKQVEAELRESREQLRRLAARVEAAREDERARIAREIHDELGQQLTGLRMDVAWLQKRLEPHQQALYQKTESMADLIGATIQDVRRITADLRPGLLDDFGLPAVIEWQLQEFEKRSGIAARFERRVDDLPLSAEQSTSLFRIVQEALTNVARHAQASAVDVCLEQVGGQLQLSIRDNGQGIEPNRQFGSRSLGLLGMRERVRLLGGRLEIHGEPGHGTTLQVQIPLPAQQA